MARRLKVLYMRYDRFRRAADVSPPLQQMQQLAGKLTHTARQILGVRAARQFIGDDSE